MTAPTALTAQGVSGRAAIALCFVVAMIEGFDIQAAGVVAPRLVPALGLGAGQMGLFFSAATLGLIVGAVVGGRVADRFGRRAALIPSLLLFGIFSLATALATDFNGLFCARLFTGFGIGGAFPSLVAIVSESSRPGRTSAAVAGLYAGLPAGGAVASLIAALTTGSSWQSIFIIGGISPLIVAPLVLKFVPNTLASATGADQNDRSPPLAALFGPDRLAPTALLWIAFFCSLVVHGLLLNWLPSLLVSRGIGKADAGFIQILFNVAGACGSLLAGRAMDAFSRRKVVALVFGGLVLSLAVLAAAPPQLAFMFVAGALVGLGSMGVQGIVYGLAPLQYPKHARGTGVGAAVAVGRAGSVAGPVLAGALIAAGGGSVGVLLGIVPVALISGVATLALIGRERQPAGVVADPARI